MSRNIESVLEAHGVDFHTSGRTELLTRCPLCGASDPGHHLSISTRNRGWRCLRNPRMHRGRSYARLLVLILHCSLERAKELTGEENITLLPSREDHALNWRKQLGLEKSESETKPRFLQFPKEFKPLTWDAPRSAGFWDYLLRPLSEQGRGFSREQAKWAAKIYNFHYATSGRYAYRIIIPIYDGYGALANWTARAIGDAEIRYMTLKTDSAVKPPSECLLGLQALFTASPARCIVAMEGPFDAISVSTIGHELGVWGTCLFGLELSGAQADLLSELEDRFERRRIILDPEQAPFRVLGMRTGGLSRRWKSLDLPPGLKDPGELVGRKEGPAFIASLVA